MAISRAGLKTYADLITLVRDEVSDPAYFADGTTSIPSKQRRWSDTRIARALNSTFEDIANAIPIGQKSSSLQYTDFSYTASAVSVALPSTAALKSAFLYHVEDVTNANDPMPCDWVSPLDIESPSLDLRYLDLRYRWTLVAGPSASEDLTSTAVKIMVRPKPDTALTLRAWTFAPHIIIGSGDSHPMTDRWSELITLSTARKLLRVDNEFTPQQEEDFQRLWGQYMGSMDRTQGPKRIRRVRGILP